MEKPIQNYYAIIFTRKTGKPVKIANNSFGCALLKAWAFDQVTPTRDAVVFGEDGIIYAYIEGKKNSIPYIRTGLEGRLTKDVLGFTVEQVISELL